MGVSQNVWEPSAVTAPSIRLETQSLEPICSHAPSKRGASRLVLLVAKPSMEPRALNMLVLEHTINYQPSIHFHRRSNKTH